MTFTEALQHFDAAVALVDGLQRKGKSMPYTGDNERMFGLVNKAGEIGVRLSKEEQNAFVAEYPNNGIYKSYGAVMKDYIHLPDSLVKDSEKLAFYLQKSWDYIITLPPKPSKKK